MIAMRSPSSSEFLDVVGDEQHGLSARAPDARELLLHDAARLRVERAERLIHQKDCGIVGENARNLHALAHAAGELIGMMMLEALKADQTDIFGNDAPALRRGTPRMRSPNSTFSSVVSQLNSAASP